MLVSMVLSANRDSYNRPGRHRRYASRPFMLVERIMDKPIIGNPAGSIAQLGQAVTSCGPKGKPATFSLVVLYGFMASGALAIGAGATLNPQPGSESLPLVAYAVGGGVIAIGLLIQVSMMLARHAQVDLHQGGIRFQEKGEDEIVPWTRLKKVLIAKYYDTRFSSHRDVVMTLVNDKELSFTSRLQGEPDRVIDAIAQHAPNVELKEISL